MLDVIACVAPIGIFFGRIANFINSELVGKISNVQWSVVFPTVDMMPRHPSQLYEAFFEGMVLYLVILYFYRRKLVPGNLTAIFLFLYGIFRFFIEFTREPDEHIGLLYFDLSLGQILSIIVLVLGLQLWKLKKNV